MFAPFANIQKSLISHALVAVGISKQRHWSVGGIGSSNCRPNDWVICCHSSYFHIRGWEKPVDEVQGLYLIRVTTIVWAGMLYVQPTSTTILYNNVDDAVIHSVWRIQPGEWEPSWMA